MAQRFQVTVRIDDRVSKPLTSYRNRVIKTSATISDEMAKVLKTRVAEKSVRRVSQRKGHNTPVSIRKFLHKQKVGKRGAVVFFDQYPVKSNEGNVFDLIELVEFGTKPHENQGRIHPGAKRKGMWRLGLREFIQRDQPELFKKAGKSLF